LILNQDALQVRVAGRTRRWLQRVAIARASCAKMLSNICANRQDRLKLAALTNFHAACSLVIGYCPGKNGQK